MCFVNELYGKVLRTTPQKSDSPSAWKDKSLLGKKKEVNNQWKTAWKCMRDVAMGVQHPCVHLMVKRARKALLLPAGSCNPTHTLVHSTALCSATLTTERWPTLFHEALQVLSPCFLLGWSDLNTRGSVVHSVVAAAEWPGLAAHHVCCCHPTCVPLSQGTF